MRIFLFHALWLAGISSLLAQPSVQILQGQAVRNLPDSEDSEELNNNDRIPEGNRILTSEEGLVRIEYPDGNSLLLGANGQLLFDKTSDEEGNPILVLVLENGGLELNWREPSGVVVTTGNASVFASEGDFSVLYSGEENRSAFASRNQEITLMNADGENPVPLGAGQYSEVKAAGIPESPKAQDNILDNFYESFFNRPYQGDSVGVTKQGAETQVVGVKDTSSQPTNIRPLFNRQDIIRKIRIIEGKDRLVYYPPIFMDPLKNHSFYFEAEGRGALAGSQDPNFHNGGSARLGMRTGPLSLAVNFPVETIQGGGYRTVPSGIPAYLDLLYYLDYQTENKSLSLHLGPIRELTYNRGNLFNQFSNELRSQIEQPLGFRFSYTPTPYFLTDYFIADVADPMVMGGILSFDNGWVQIGAAGAADLNQGGGLVLGDNGFNGQEVPKISDKSPTKLIWAAEPFMEFNVYNDEAFHLFGYGGVSFLFAGDAWVGATYQIPGVYFILKRTHFYLEGVSTLDKAHYGYFNDFYLEDRTRIHRDANGANARSLSLNDGHPPMGSARGFRTGIDFQVKDHLWFGWDFGQNIGSGKEEKRDQDSSLTPVDKSLLKRNTNRFLKSRLAVNAGWIPGLQRMELYYRMEGGFFGRQIITPAADTGQYRNLINKPSKFLFFSLNSEYGAFIEYMLFSKSSIVARFRNYYLDFNGNGIADPDDQVMEFSLGWRIIF